MDGENRNNPTPGSKRKQQHQPSSRSEEESELSGSDEDPPSKQVMLSPGPLAGYTFGFDPRINVNIKVVEGEVVKLNFGVKERDSRVLRGPKEKVPALWEIPVLEEWNEALSRRVVGALLSVVSPTVRLFLATNPRGRKNETYKIILLPGAQVHDLSAYDKRVLLDHWRCLIKWAKTAVISQLTETAVPPLDEFMTQYFERLLEPGDHGAGADDFTEFCKLLSSIAEPSIWKWKTREARAQRALVQT
ncbi:hypothetical protein N656DRAFT_802283 [Canariomyces notabilis]|uniref:Uncharacterized protein n=1 Tax=Canariomyces notabilis TaxID=2074819 RepID=A0AAN6QI35_9PEZI|nr:hypothetical protein N656DRAFT_802283 [Canariomyces arenarius]